MLAAPRLPSLLLFGPPGCGKSTLALILAKAKGRPYVRVSAPEAGLSALRELIKGKEILILDELHRFSKAQQDFFLPLLETGDIVLLATTTENPSFSVTRQLLSRLHVLRLRPLSHDELMPPCWNSNTSSWTSVWAPTCSTKYPARWKPSWPIIRCCARAVAAGFSCTPPTPGPASVRPWPCRSRAARPFRDAG